MPENTKFTFYVLTPVWVLDFTRINHSLNFYVNSIRFSFNLINFPPYFRKIYDYYGYCCFRYLYLGYRFSSVPTL